MNKIKLIILFLLIIVPNTVKAKCSLEDKVRLQSLASNLSFSYDYKEVNTDYNSISFSVTITNLHPDLYIRDNIRKTNLYYNANKEVTINGYNDGVTLGYAIYSNTSNCKGEYLVTSYVTLPPYNPFYNDPICRGITDYKLCNRFTKINMSYNSFVKQVTKYKNDKGKQPINPEKPAEDEFVEKIISFLSKYSFYLFGGIIIVCSGLIFYLSHKDDFDLK